MAAQAITVTFPTASQEALHIELEAAEEDEEEEVVVTATLYRIQRM